MHAERQNAYVRHTRPSRRFAGGFICEIYRSRRINGSSFIIHIKRAVPFPTLNKYVRKRSHSPQMLLARLNPPLKPFLRRISTLRSTTTLPDRITPTLRANPPHPPSTPTFPFLNPESVPPRPSFEEFSPAGRVCKLTWPSNPRNILVVKKRRDDKVKEAAITFAR